MNIFPPHCSTMIIFQWQPGEWLWSTNKSSSICHPKLNPRIQHEGRARAEEWGVTEQSIFSGIALQLNEGMCIFKALGIFSFSLVRRWWLSLITSSIVRCEGFAWFAKVIKYLLRYNLKRGWRSRERQRESFQTTVWSSFASVLLTLDHH